MIHQVRANLFFDIEDEANDFYHDCELAFAKSILVNEGQPEQEHSLIELIENHHDEAPNAPCSMIAEKDNLPG